MLGYYKVVNILQLASCLRYYLDPQKPRMNHLIAEDPFKEDLVTFVKEIYSKTHLMLDLSYLFIILIVNSGKNRLLFQSPLKNYFMQKSMKKGLKKVLGY